MSAQVPGTAAPTTPRSSAPPMLPAPSPIGVGAQPTTLSSISSSETLETVAGYFVAVCNFFRKFFIHVLVGIRFAIDAIIDCCGGETEIEETLDPATTHWQLPVQDTQTASTVSDPFSEIPISGEEQLKIYTIIHAMGQVTGLIGWLKLLSKSNMINRLGNEIENVHSLKFLEYLFKHPELPQDITVFKKHAWTWDPFITGLSNKMQREAASIPLCKAGFAHSLNVNLADLEPFFAQNNCVGMVEFLLDVKMGRKTSVWIEPPAAAAPSPIPPLVRRASSTPALRTTSQTLYTPPHSAISLHSSPAGYTVRIADLPFTREDEQALTELIPKYAQNRMRFVLNRNLDIKWAQLGERHPLKLLVALHSNSALMVQLNTIFQDTDHKARFLTALTAQLAKRPIGEVRPYLDEFANHCLLDPNRVRQLVENKNWEQLVVDLEQTQRPN